VPQHAKRRHIDVQKLHLATPNYRSKKCFNPRTVPHHVPSIVSTLTQHHGVDCRLAYSKQHPHTPETFSWDQEHTCGSLKFRNTQANNVSQNSATQKNGLKELGEHHESCVTFNVLHPLFITYTQEWPDIYNKVNVSSTASTNHDVTSTSSSTPQGN
jgi:hypothetical protein